MKPPSLVRGSIHRRGATNSALRPYLSSSFFTPRAYSLISSSVMLFISGTASSSWNCTAEKPSSANLANLLSRSIILRVSGP